ncbi:hypothetical protein DL346_01315 [Paenibacillus montanisoli]|uniref:Uncharacterized protein n=1 Tax=Paenibacillus montanisoli TaxID=2081970 RepID=A0A328U2Y7_9BACL|nr:hypothetical protein DL346_01315 [Paenibacillus montanisoli]
MSDGQILMLCILVTAVIGIGGYFAARYGGGRSYEIELTLDEVKDYFFKRHRCRDCDTKLKRIANDEYLGEGWTNNMGTHSYSKQYKRSYHLQCPKCLRRYSAEDY